MLMCSTMCVLIAVNVPVCLIYGNGSERSTAMNTVAELRSERPESREAAARSVLDDRRRLVADLQRIVRETVGDEARRGTARDAIVLLGQLRAVESAPLLVENLDFKVFYKDVKRPQPPEDLYPCVGALIEIGMPAIEPVLRRAGMSDDEDVLRNTAYVVKKILGRKLALALLNDRGQLSAAERQRMERVREVVAKGSP